MIDTEHRTDGLISASVVAAKLAISARHLRRLSDAGRVPRPVRIGRAVRWRSAEIRAWISAGCPDARHWKWIDGR